MYCGYCYSRTALHFNRPSSDSFPLLPTSFIAVVSKCNNMLSLKSTTKSSASYHDCLIKVAIRNSKKFQNHKSLLRAVPCWKKNAREHRLSKNSFQNVRCFLFFQAYIYSEIDVFASADVYRSFSLKSMHRLALGASKMLKDCLVDYLLDSTRTTAVIKYCSCQPNSSQCIQQRVLLPTTELLKFTEMLSCQR